MRRREFASKSDMELASAILHNLQVSRAIWGKINATLFITPRVLLLEIFSRGLFGGKSHLLLLMEITPPPDTKLMKNQCYTFY